MQKKLIALAISALASSGVLAQANVTIYGIMDVGYTHKSGTYQNNGVFSVGTATQEDRNGIDSGVQSGSRLGFRGEEDLGGGMKAIFTIEGGINADDGTNAQGAVWGRQTWVGLSNNWGALTLGRQYSPFYEVGDGIMSAVGTPSFGTQQIHPYDTAPFNRISNSIKYASPSFAGFKASVIYAPGENQATGTADPNLWSVSGTYANGPVVVAIAYIKAEDPGIAGALAAVGDEVDATMLAGSYDFGFAKVHAGYTAIGSDGPSLAAGQLDQGNWHLGVVVPRGPHTFRLAYDRADDKSTRNLDADHWAAVYEYNFSKRTNLYALYGRVNNDNGAGYTANGGTHGSFVVAAATNAAVGRFTEGFGLGLRHKF